MLLWTSANRRILIQRNVNNNFIIKINNKEQLLKEIQNVSFDLLLQPISRQRKLLFYLFKVTRLFYINLNETKKIFFILYIKI